MYELQYSNPSSVDAAAKELSNAKDGKFLAGGMTLIPTLKARLSSADVLVDLKGSNLSNITVSASEVEIGAMTRHADVATSSDIKKSLSLIHI